MEYCSHLCLIKTHLINSFIMKALQQTESKHVQTLKAVSQMKTMNMMEDKFTCSEAKDLICQMIDQQINFYKLQYMSIWEGNHSMTTTHLENKIADLVEQKEEINRLIKHAKEEGYNLSIDSKVEIRLDR